jgi:hypothetical protein
VSIFCAISSLTEQSRTSLLIRSARFRLLARAEREIELLREYRTRLVADVVTGKLDVRAAAAKLPSQEIPSEIASLEEPITEYELNEADAQPA